MQTNESALEPQFWQFSFFVHFLLQKEIRKQKRFLIQQSEIQTENPLDFFSDFCPDVLSLWTMKTEE